MLKKVQSCSPKSAHYDWGPITSWHIVSPLHQSSTPSMRQLQQPPQTSSMVVDMVNWGDVSKEKENIEVTLGTRLVEKDALNSNNKTNNNMKRLPIELETEEEDEDNGVKPLRRVRVMLPDKLSEINGYVSLSPFINSTPDASPQAFENSSLIRSPMSITTSTTCREEGTQPYNKSHKNFSRRFFNPSRISSLWLAIHN